MPPRARRRQPPFDVARDHSAPLEIPTIPFGPGRAGYSRQTRRRLGLALGVLVLAVVGFAALLVLHPPRVAPRVVTIPVADRAASPALLRAAEAIDFEPNTEANAGQIEREPLGVAQTSSSPSLLTPRSSAPPFALRTPTGEPIALSHLRGRPVLVEFFATWCPHCAAEAPHLATLALALQRQRVAFLAVDADGETAPSVLAYSIYFELPFPALLDPSSRPGSFSAPGAPGAVTTAYRVHVYPTFYVLDPNGRVVWAGSGEQPDALLRLELRRASAASPVPEHGRVAGGAAPLSDL